MSNLDRFELPNELKHIRNAIKHVQQRFRERFNLIVSEEFIFKLSELIIDKKIPIKKRTSTNQVWVELNLPNTKKAYILFNEALMCPQTVLKANMYRY